MNKKQALFSFLLLTLVFYSTFIIYLPGLDSMFFLDDIPNLDSIGKYYNLGTLNDFLLYLLEEKTNLLGRPVSLASFYLSDNTWKGMSVFDFKKINLMLHLVNGILVFWLSFLIIKTSHKEQSLYLPFSILTSTLWVLNPMHTNTVFYAVQRMTELAALFSLLTIIFYIYARYSPLKKLYIPITGVLICTILSILSKENGTLVFIYILIIEKLIIEKNSSLRPLPKIIKILLLIPVIGIFILLLKSGWLDQTNRPFNTYERLLTESRILWDYFSKIIYPPFNGSSLLQDEYLISTNIFQPILTLPSVIGLLLILYLSFVIKNKFTFMSLGILWFIGGHLLESSTIALELYFEHRNYLPMLGIIIIISYYSIILIKKQAVYFKKVLITIITLYISYYSITTYNISQLWSNPVRLVSYWLEDHPQSQRTIETLDGLIANQVSHESRLALSSELDNAAIYSKNTSYQIFRKINILCETGRIATHDLTEVIDKLKQIERISAPTPGIFATFISTWHRTQCGGLNTEQIIFFIEQLRNLSIMQQKEMIYTLHRWQAEVHAWEGNLSDTMLHLESAYELKKSIDLLLLQAAYLASAGLYTDAEHKINNLENSFCKHWRSCLILKLRQPDLDNLRSALQDKLQQEKANHHAQQAVDYSASQK